MEDISIGNEIKDGFKRTDKWVKANIGFISEMESFYKQRALIEREYAEKLQKLTTESFQKVSKLSTTLSVGEEPTITPGSLECASVVAWKEVLVQTENIAKEKRELGSNFETNVAASLNKLQSKYSAIRDRWKGFDDELTSIRDKNYSEMSTKKKHYDSCCESMESQRSKSLKSSGERAQEKLAKRESEMNIAKNDYLITISVCNRLKDKYYYQDTPELLDGLQDLNEAKVSKVNSIWLSSSILEKESNEKISKFVDAIDVVVKQNLPKLDTAMFVKHNMANWVEPVDFNYIPSQIWHDDEKMIVNDATLTSLKIKLNNACSTYETYTSICNDEKQSVEELLVQRNKLVGDTFNEVQIKSPADYQCFEDLLIKSIQNLQKFTNDDTKRVMAEVEIETIQGSTGDIDMTITTPINKEKKSKFGFLKFKHDQEEDAEPRIQQLSESVNNISIEPSNRKGRMFSSLGKLVDAYNTPVNQRAPSLNFSNGGTGSISASTSTLPAGGVTTATALYAYEVTGDDELPMASGETFTVVELDDGSGWTCVSNSSGSEGLVPTSYLKIEEHRQQKKQGPKVSPRKNARLVKKMKILYDYEAQGDDELTVNAGDIVVILNEDDGSGWTEGEIDGYTGLFPTSYGKTV
ncbi:hypothetical protein PICMEDRAFT_16415 [Pichia membranifaciens NRRL Y-2026]|uniref:Protein BZZ1 n=1 Tax=Pichia membranifaciens NRRL Y-2026 TaxID=763406 RepID=A0A1E3NKA5_9ASCO|nr:hypothetical protein PICMEDRAFT_16415 [Pichia membranifaciens NRRL Y-2026]ODQ46551.1 hypothetical protein PICMEDRAFT_16415 [Pichia membranifaciens NRRL Y-2026]